MAKKTRKKALKKARKKAEAVKRAKRVRPPAKKARRTKPRTKPASAFQVMIDTINETERMRTLAEPQDND